MGMTQTVSQYFDASVEEKIYLLLGVGGEWDKYHKVHTGLDKPKILTKGFATKDLLATSVANPRIGTHDTGTVLFSGRQLEVGEAMIFIPFTPNDWKDNFPVFQPTGSRIDLKLNTTVMKAFMDLVKSTVQEELADLEVQGDDVLSSPDQLRFTDGLIKIMTADGDVIDYGNVGLITKSNVLGIITAMEKLIPHRLRKTKLRAKVKLAMSFTTYDLAMEANRDTQQNATFLTTPDVTKTAKGYELVPLSSMPDDVIFITIMTGGSDANLAKGVWFENDEKNFAVYKEQPMDDDWIVGLKFSIGFNYSAGADIVLYQGS